MDATAFLPLVGKDESEEIGPQTVLVSPLNGATMTKSRTMQKGTVVYFMGHQIIHDVRLILINNVDNEKTNVFKQNGPAWHDENVHEMIRKQGDKTFNYKEI